MKNLGSALRAKAADPVQYTGITGLICAMIECAVDDVRALRRQGLLDEHGNLTIPPEPEARPKLSAVTHRTPNASRFVIGRDALNSFTDGRLERSCDLINSPLLNPDRIKAHIFGPTFDLQTRSGPKRGAK